MTHRYVHHTNQFLKNWGLIGKVLKYWFSLQSCFVLVCKHATTKILNFVHELISLGSGAGQSKECPVEKILPHLFPSKGQNLAIQQLPSGFNGSVHLGGKHCLKDSVLPPLKSIRTFAIDFHRNRIMLECSEKKSGLLQSSLSIQ